MYSDKQNILQLVALLRAHDIRNVVLCPGRHNAPLLHTLANHPFFTCHAVTDERSAGFFAFGLALSSGRPAAVCCTSGTALLNLHPAVAEAYYQQVPLIVISADRPAAWMGQQDEQTLPQPDVFGSLVKMSVNLPEAHTPEEVWYCNRLVNEALLELNHHGKGPVHINIPISEPLFQFTAEELPEVRVITRYQGLNIYDRQYNDLIARLNTYTRRLIVVGQMNLIYQFERKIGKQIYKHFAWLAEHTGNQTVPGIPVKNFDTILYSLPEEEQLKLVPDLLITYGGHIVSKRIKQFLRQNPPKEHWHVSADGKVTDTFCVQTVVIEMDPFEFVEKIAYLIENKVSEYPKRWEQLSKQIPVPDFAFSEMAAVGKVLTSLPTESVLHLGSSSTVRYAQLFPIPNTVEVCCNCGASGIEGTLSTALGYAWASDKLNFILIDDLSFFCDMNALWCSHLRGNLRILLLNNGGGEFFQALPELEKEPLTLRFVTAPHRTSAESWARERGFDYVAIRSMEELVAGLPAFMQAEQQIRPQFMEVFTDREEDMRLLKEYYHTLKT